MEDKGEVLYELKPKYDFIYEMMMPTGKKTKSALMGIIVSVIIKVILSLLRSYIVNMNNELALSVYNVINILMIVVIVFSIILFIARIVMQVLEYKGMSYKFYKNCMVFENNFLSQTKKTIEYPNIKEVEIRRTVMDRIMNYGVIILYTSAEKTFGNATIIYAIKDTQNHYNEIEKLIHAGRSENVQQVPNEEVPEELTHDEFKEKISINNNIDSNE